MSSKIYIVISEEFYGGDLIRAFSTADAKEDAELYAKKCIEQSTGKIDFIVKEIDLTEI